VLNREQLQETCLFCDPAMHGQANQVLLRSDHFFLFAGTEPLTEGYIILAPHRCDQPEQPFCSFADIPAELLDEAVFLRGLVSEFYRDVYHQEASMHFEYGRLRDRLSISDEPKCEGHAFLSCYPCSFPLWEDLENLEIKGVGGLADLREATGDSPYLLVENSFIDESVPADSATREKWISKIAPLEAHSQIPAEYLHRLLKVRLKKANASKKPLTSQVDLVGRLIKGFRNWLQSTHKYALNLDDGGVAQLIYLESVEKSNRIGNNSVAQDFHQTWAGRLHYRALGQFLSSLPLRQQECLRILDVGCGPGHYLKVFYALGFESIGIDISDEMVNIAKQALGTEMTGGEAMSSTPFPRIENTSLFDLGFDSNSFDGIWYNAVVVHVPRRLLPSNLGRLNQILKEDGVLYLSALLGSGSVVRREGRVFFYYTQDELIDLFGDAGFKIITQWSDEIELSARGGQRKKSWAHFLLRKKNSH
jgi:SAM-dependent methyltransferase